MTTEIKGANGKAKVTYENELTDWIEPVSYTHLTLPTILRV